MADQSGAPALLTLRDVSKSFGGVHALTGVSIEVQPGTVHAILGENGAGKSTLCQIIAGLLSPDNGEVLINGRAGLTHSAASAQQAGISFVPQELSIVPHLSLAENICMGQLPSFSGMLDRRGLAETARRALARLALPLDPHSLVGSFGPGIQQMVMIARGLSRDANLFILDEPTAALTSTEVDHLFQVIHELRQAGSSFIYISHRLQELERVADEITILRDGRKILTERSGVLSHDEIIRAMVGREIAHFYQEESPDQGGKAEPLTVPKPRLSVRGLSRTGKFDNVAFDVAPGEILGVAGLLGAGRTEVMRCIFGIDPISQGVVELNGKPLKVRNARDAIRQGICLVPEERKKEALVLHMSIADNISAAHLARTSRRGWLSSSRSAADAEEMRDRFAIKASSIEAPVSSLSGGNQQKVVLARWMLSKASVYLLDEPTRGVDVGAKAEIYGVIQELARGGSAVVVVSSELPELLSLCHRIVVMREGSLVGEFARPDFTEEAILAAAMGQEEVRSNG
jgi:ABC-type sugar transport system ATPase subunit